MLRRIAELRIPAVEDIQLVVVRIRVVVHMEPVQSLADTVEVVLDTVLAAGIVAVLEMDMMSTQVQDQELDTDWGLHQQCDTGLTLEECTEVDLRYIVLCFLFLSHCYYRKKTNSTVAMNKYLIRPFNDSIQLELGGVLYTVITAPTIQRQPQVTTTSMWNS